MCGVLALEASKNQGMDDLSARFQGSEKSVVRRGA